MRESGILLPIFSLASKYGIGCFSKEAYEFIDFLKDAGQKKWQILPLGPTSFGDSPYQSFSAFAGNPYFIDLESLIKEGLLTEAECEAADFGSQATAIDYGKLYQARKEVLWQAFLRFDRADNADFQLFREKNQYWLDDYCLFMALKDRYHGASWMEWDRPDQLREEEAMRSAKEELKEQIAFYQFQQFLFRQQWDDLHAYANHKGIEIIGDIPIYVAFDSADTWADRQQFEFTEQSQASRVESSAVQPSAVQSSAVQASAVAGCPPDSFAPQGQLWGNPLYRWEYHKETGYHWWITRLKYCFELYDILRLDHFRAFDEYYSIPAQDSTAEHGHWIKGPGYDFFQIMKQQLGGIRMIAEDLGFLTDSVRELVHRTGYPGMKVLQFAFDSREQSNYLPCFYEQNCVVYTGTHDNDTIAGWFQTLEQNDRAMAVSYMGAQQVPAAQMYLQFVRLALASVGNLCIIPIQDYLGLGSEARINTPSTVGSNWQWRLAKGQLTKEHAAMIKELSELYGRE